LPSSVNFREQSARYRSMVRDASASVCCGHTMHTAGAGHAGVSDIVVCYQCPISMHVHIYAWYISYSGYI